MKYAIVDNVRVEAQKGLNGLCPICHEPLVPRCGSKKINHWAHKKSTHCDKWWESETEWKTNTNYFLSSSLKKLNSVASAIPRLSI